MRRVALMTRAVWLLLAACSAGAAAAADSPDAARVGQGASMTKGADGLGLISYLDATRLHLKVAHCDDVACTTATLSVIDGPTRFHPLTPCRVADTRTTQSPLAANQGRPFAVAGSCGVPPDARAVAANAVAVNPGQAGNLRVYPVGHLLPLASTVKFADGRTRANNGIVSLGVGGQVVVLYDVVAGSTAGTHFVLDIFGYFR